MGKVGLELDFPVLGLYLGHFPFRQPILNGGLRMDLEDRFGRQLPEPGDVTVLPMEVREKVPPCGQIQGKTIPFWERTEKLISEGKRIVAHVPELFG